MRVTLEVYSLFFWSVMAADYILDKTATHMVVASEARMIMSDEFYKIKKKKFRGLMALGT